MEEMDPEDHDDSQIQAPCARKTVGDANYLMRKSFPTSHGMEACRRTRPAAHQEKIPKERKVKEDLLHDMVTPSSQGIAPRTTLPEPQDHKVQASKQRLRLRTFLISRSSGPLSHLGHLSSLSSLRCDMGDVATIRGCKAMESISLVAACKTSSTLHGMAMACGLQGQLAVSPRSSLHRARGKGFC